MSGTNGHGSGARPDVSDLPSEWDGERRALRYPAIDPLVDLYDRFGREALIVRLYYRTSQGGLGEREGPLMFAGGRSHYRTVSVFDGRTEKDDIRMLRAKTDDYGKMTLKSETGRTFNLGYLYGWEVIGYVDD